MTNISDKFIFDRGLELKNRVMMAPMTTKMSFFDGVVTTDEIEYYGAHSGEIGALITGAANVQPNGKGWEGELGAYDAKFLPGLTKLSKAIKVNDTKAILQIFHGGRMTNSKITGETIVSASAISAEREGAETPRELSEAEIYELIENFQKATLLAIEAGFDGVELHGANTYLLQQFFSPHSNRREDKWGGSLEKRFTFIDLLVDSIIKTIDESDAKDFILGYRFSPEEYETPGIRFEDTLYLVDKLANKKLDYLHISLNDYSKKSVDKAYQEKSMLQYVHEKIAGRVPLVSVGDITTGNDAEKALENSELFAIGKAILIDPNWTSKVLSNEENKIRTRLSRAVQDELKISNGVWGFLEGMMPDRID